MEAARTKGLPKYMDWEAGGEDVTVSPDDVTSRWYVRSNATPETLKESLGEVTLLARPGAPAGETAVLTPAMSRGELEAKLAGQTLHSVFRVLD